MRFVPAVRSRDHESQEQREPRRLEDLQPRSQVPRVRGLSNLLAGRPR